MEDLNPRKSEYFNAEMEGYTDDYVAFVLEKLNEAEKHDKNAVLFIEQERIRREKEYERQEREFGKRISLEMLNELKAQNAQLKKEYEESQVELKKSKKYNWIMLIISVVSAAAAIVSMIIPVFAPKYRR